MTSEKEQRSTPIQQCDPEPLKREIEQLRQQLAEANGRLVDIHSGALQLRQQRDELAATLKWLTARKDREIAELKHSDSSLQQTIDSMSAEIQSWHNRLAEIEQLNRPPLAASQAREKVYRDALGGAQIRIVNQQLESALGALGIALSQPSDTAALEAYVAERVKELVSGLELIADMCRKRCSHEAVMGVALSHLAHQEEQMASGEESQQEDARCELECNAELVEMLSCEDDEVLEEIEA